MAKVLIATEKPFAAPAVAGIKDIIEEMVRYFLAENQLELYNVEFLKELRRRLSRYPNKSMLY